MEATGLGEIVEFVSLISLAMATLCHTTFCFLRNVLYPTVWRSISICRGHICITDIDISREGAGGIIAIEDLLESMACVFFILPLILFIGEIVFHSIKNRQLAVFMGITWCTLAGAFAGSFVFRTFL